MHTTGSRTFIGARPLLLVVGIVAAIAFGLFAMHVNSARAGVAVTFTVNNSGDESDVTPGDGVCDIETGPPIHCTLRAAIEEANALNGPNIIHFTATDTLLENGVLGDSSLGITERVTIDASGNPDGFTIDVDDSTCNALRLTTGSSGSIIRGLNIIHDECNGLTIYGGAGDTIGGDPSVGVAPAGQGNVIHDNGENGILIAPAGFDKVDLIGSLGGHVIDGNRIGITPLGTTAEGNGSFGIDIEGGSGSDITIGGDPAGTPAHFPNIISANGSGGIEFDDGGTADVIIQNNWIGLDVHGNASDPFANVGDGIDVYNTEATATIKNNHIAGGGFDPSPGSGQPGYDGIYLTSAGNTILGNCIGFNSSCAGTAGGFADDAVDISESESGGNTVGDGTTAGRNVMGNTWFEGVYIDGDDNVANGNYIGFGLDGEESSTIFDDCVEIDGSDHNQIKNNLMGNCGFSGGLNGVDVTGDNNLIENNDMGRGTSTATSDAIDGPCVYLDGDSNKVLTNVMANCDDSAIAPAGTSIELADGNFNTIQGNDITSPLSGDAIDLEGGGIANLVASRIFRMVNPTTGDLPIDLNTNGVTVNDGGDTDGSSCPDGTQTNCYHNYPVFAPTSLTAGCARGSTGPFDHVRIYSKSTASGVVTFELQGEGDANIAGDFQICLGNVAQMTVVGTATTTVASTTDTGCALNCTSEFSVTEQVVPAGATPTSTASNTPTITLTPTITNTPPPTNTPVPPTVTPVPATATPSKFCGDVNDNGSVDSVDALLILQLSAGLVQTLLNAPSADVNNSGGTPNAIDAQLILQVEASLIQIADLHCS